MKRFSAFVLLAVLVIGCNSPAANSSPSVGAQPSDAIATSTEAAPSQPAAAEAPVTVTGSGIENSAPFRLDGGVYLVEWTATLRSDSCYHGANLRAVDPDAPIFEPLANEGLDSTTPLTGTTYIYDLAGGDYYINANSGCDWSFVFTAQ